MKRLSAPTYAQLYYTSAASVPEEMRQTVAANFLRFLRRQRAMKLLPRILAHLQRIDDLAHQRTRVRVTAASRADQQILEQRLPDILGPVVLDLTVDSSLLGGAVLQVGDTAIDGSLKTRLRQLHHQLTDHAHA